MPKEDKTEKKAKKKFNRKIKKALKKQAGVVKEFQEFISKGRGMDLAVGIIIGAAFTAAVNSVVTNLITPILGVLIGGIDFASLSITLPSFFSNTDVPPPVFNYGLFIQSVINFFIIAVCVFIIVKFMNTIKSKLEKEEAEKPAPPKAADVVLLEEIRDLLKEAANENNKGK